MVDFLDVEVIMMLSEGTPVKTRSEHAETVQPRKSSSPAENRLLFLVIPASEFVKELAARPVTSPRNDQPNEGRFHVWWRTPACGGSHPGAACKRADPDLSPQAGRGGWARGQFFHKLLRRCDEAPGG